MKPGQKRITSDGYGYGEGMAIISYNNTQIHKFQQTSGNDFQDMFAMFKAFQGWNALVLERKQDPMPKVHLDSLLVAKQIQGKGFRDFNKWLLFYMFRRWNNITTTGNGWKKSRKKATSYYYVIKNKPRYTIQDIHVVNNVTGDIYMDLHCTSTDEMLYNIPIHIIKSLFQP